MVSLVDITEDNYYEVCKLRVAPEQEGYVAAAVSILARAYAKRNRNARRLVLRHSMNSNELAVAKHGSAYLQEIRLPVWGNNTKRFH